MKLNLLTVKSTTVGGNNTSSKQSDGCITSNSGLNLRKNLFKNRVLPRSNSYGIEVNFALLDKSDRLFSRNRSVFFQIFN